jgi:hypothetical protein
MRPDAAAGLKRSRSQHILLSSIKDKKTCPEDGLSKLEDVLALRRQRLIGFADIG